MIMIRPIVVSVSVLFLFAIAVAELNAGEQLQATAADNPQTEVKASLFVPSLYVTPKSAIRSLNKEPGKTIMVDVRRKDLFEKARIPGAINVALYSIKTKAFLKHKPILLIDEGYGSTEMQRTCSNLNAAGYQARILFGGIKLWREIGGPITGDFFYLNSLKKISPANYYYNSRKLGHWEIIDTSVKSSDAISETFPKAHQIPYGNEEDEFTKALRSLFNSKKRDRFSSVLVLNQDGKDYAKMEDDVEAARLSNVFFLEGGLSGYQQFIRKLAVMQNHEKGVKVNPRKCATCP